MSFMGIQWGLMLEPLRNYSPGWESSLCDFLFIFYPCVILIDMPGIYSKTYFPRSWNLWFAFETSLHCFRSWLLPWSFQHQNNNLWNSRMFPLGFRLNAWKVNWVDWLFCIFPNFKEATKVVEGEDVCRWYEALLPSTQQMPPNRLQLILQVFTL